MKNLISKLIVQIDVQKMNMTMSARGYVSIYSINVSIFYFTHFEAPMVYIFQVPRDKFCCRGCIPMKRILGARRALRGLPRGYLPVSFH